MAVCAHLQEIDHLVVLQTCSRNVLVKDPGGCTKNIQFACFRNEPIFAGDVSLLLGGWKLPMRSRTVASVNQYISHPTAGLGYAKVLVLHYLGMPGTPLHFGMVLLQSLPGRRQSGITEKYYLIGSHSHLGKVFSQWFTGHVPILIRPSCE